MSLWKKYIDKLHLKQWSIGLTRYKLEDIIREKRTHIPVKWMHPESNKYSYADPFLFSDGNGQVYVLMESVSTVDLDGKITLLTLDESLEVVAEKTLLETEAHLSYPFTFKENNKTYVFPENAFSGSLYCYEFDSDKKILVNKTKVIDLPLVDASILKKDGKYWLFATMIGEARNRDLHLFYADNLMGPYTPHPGNPVKQDITSSRPAGNLVEVDGQIYRPAQNCESYYGESITINRITKLDTSSFAEEKYFSIRSKGNDAFNYGIHTVNACGDIIVIDGQKAYFQPIKQLARKIRNILERK